MTNHKPTIKVLYADTHEELTVKMIGLHHGHCVHHYIGTIEKMPIETLLKFREHINPYKQERHILIYED